MAIFHRIDLEIDRMTRLGELEFWRSLGYVRRQRTRASGPTEFLRSEVRDGGVANWINLVPVETAVVSESVAAVLIPEDITEALGRLDRLPFVVAANQLESWFGAARVVVRSPTGHRIELLEFAPVVKWPGEPPEYMKR